MVWCLAIGAANAGSNIDLLPDKAFHKEGDLNLGGFTYVQGYSLETPCSDQIGVLQTHQIGHQIAFVIEQYNKRQDILPNVTLGYAILDECFRDIPAIPRFLQLLPILNSSADPFITLSFGRHYDVVGLVGPRSDTPNMIMATMTGFFQIPQISFASLPELSDKTRFPYFFRTILPNQYLSYAFMKMSRALKWEYISVVYLEASYGFDGNRFVAKWAQQEGICIEESYGFGYDNSEAEFEATVKSLVNGRSRVVFLFTYATSMGKLLGAYRKLNPNRKLIWVIPLPVAYLRQYHDVLKGSFYIQNEVNLDPEFKTYYESINPWNTPNDPWLSMIWEQFYKCNMNPKDDEIDCHDFPNLTGIPSHRVDEERFDGEPVHAYAHALHSLIEDHCQYAVGNRKELRSCVKPELLANYLRKVNIDIPGVHIKFTDTQDNLRPIVIDQIQEDMNTKVMTQIRVAKYDLRSEDITIFEEKMQWPDEIPDEEYNVQNVPESVCSYPCGIGEMYIKGEVPCCWECKRCRDNEIVTDNQTKCTICDELTWPEPVSNFTLCSVIPPTYLTWENVYAIGLMLLAALGIFVVLVIMYVVIKNRDRRVIKGSSCELITIILVGILLAFVTMPAFINKPNDPLCSCSRTGFSVSSTLIFAPLFIKSVRIYRVFAASDRFERSLKWIGLESQLTFTAILMGIQVKRIEDIIIKQNCTLCFVF